MISIDCKRQVKGHWTICQCILTVLLFSSQLAAADLPTLVLNGWALPPLNTSNQDGFQDEVAREALRRIGYNIDVIRMPAERALRSSNSGLIDGDISRIAGLETIYPNIIRVPEKIIDWSFNAFSKKPVNLEKGWDSLANQDVAIITGWKIFERNLPKSATLIKADNVKQLFSLLQKDRTSIILYEAWGGKYLIKKSQMQEIEIRQPPLAVKEKFIYLHKKHKALIPRLSKALADMKKDGSYDRLVEKHLAPLIKK